MIQIIAINIVQSNVGCFDIMQQNLRELRKKLLQFIVKPSKISVHHSLFYVTFQLYMNDENVSKNLCLVFLGE